MTDYYIGDIAEETGTLFGYWADNHLDMNQMVTSYLRSHLRENTDKRYARYCTQSWKEMADQFPSIYGEQAYDATLCEWLGYFYTYLQGYTNRSSRELIEKYPFQVMYPRSNVLHDLDMDLAIKKVAE
jgi:hypothetical protein